MQNDHFWKKLFCKHIIIFLLILKTDRNYNNSNRKQMKNYAERTKNIEKEERKKDRQKKNNK